MGLLFRAELYRNCGDDRQAARGDKNTRPAGLEQANGDVSSGNRTRHGSKICNGGKPLKHERATEEIRELAALYALGSLTQHEARSFEAHMREGCTVCEAELHRFAHTIAGMGFAAEEVPAPDYIRDLLLARIDREPRLKEPATAGPVGETKSHETASHAAAVPFKSSQPVQQKSSILPWILAVAVIALGILAFYYWKSAEEAGHQLQAKLAADRADKVELQKQMGSQKARFAQLEEIEALATKPETRIARLIGQAATPSYAGTVLWDTQKNRCRVLGAFAPTPQGKVHQLWFFSPTAKIPIGLFRPDPDGQVSMSLRVPKEAAGATAVVVTLEPDNGSQIPTAPYCAAGRID
jgi:anti-sigma-K factor RskA